MGARHTPGPWVVGEDIIDMKYGYVGNNVFAENMWVAQAMGVHVYVAVGEIKHNANLIAAAPDLLEACEQMLYHASLGPDEVGNQQWSEDCERMKAAISKAKGET